MTTMATFKRRFIRAAREEGRVWRVAVPLMAAYALLIAPAANMISETRWWRDATDLTPFSDVVVAHQQIVPTGLEISGTMLKRRCEYLGLDAYVTLHGIRYRTAIDTGPEDAKRPGGSRAPTRGPQAWGPWVIEWSGQVPQAWSIWARHQCPHEPVPEVNLFARGEWK